MANRWVGMLLPLALACWWGGVAATGAEFSLESPLPRLRRLQPCTGCGAALVVTAFRSGEQVRCALCERIAPRLSDDRTLTLLYQGCGACGAQLDATGCVGGQEVRCGSCHAPQVVLAEVAAFANAPGRVAERTRFLEQMKKYAAGFRPSAPTAVVVSVPPPVSGSRPPTPVPSPAAQRPTATESPPSAAMDPPSERPASDSPRRTLPVAPPDRLPSGGGGDVRTAPAVTLADFFGNGGSPAGSGGGSPSMASAQGSGGKAVGATSLALTPVAYVNGRPILRREVDEAVAERLRRLRAELGARLETPEGAAALSRREAEERKAALDALIERSVALQAAERDGNEPPESAVKEQWDELRRQNYPGDARARARDNALMGMVVKTFTRRAAAGVTPEQVRKEYERRRSEFTMPERWDVRAAVIYKDRLGRADPRPAEVIAREVLSRLEAGEPFAALAARYNEGPQDPGSGGLRPVGLYDGAVREAVKEALASKGATVTGPVESEDWVSILKLAGREEARVKTLGEVSEEIRRGLAVEAGNKGFGEWLARERKGAEIRVVPE